MSRLILLISFLTTATIVKGQDGFIHAFARAGVAYPSALQFSVGFDLAAKYHSAYELSFTYYRTTSQYENMLLGLNYKPVVIRHKNSNLRFRFGGYLGTDLDRFVASPNAGMEWVQSISGKIDVVLANNNGYFFGAERGHRWRLAAEIGFRLPL